MAGVKYKTTVMAVSIHRPGENPYYGVDVTMLSLEDESGGGFFVLKQLDKEIRIELEEIEAIHQAAKKMLEDYEKAEKE